MVRTGGEVKMDALELLRKAEWDADHNLITAGEYEKIIELFKDVKVVVRCKDCKHLFDGEHTKNCCDALMEKAGWLKEISVSPGWFCADGERR